jgi:phosphatidate cytidylyltransferase
VLFLFLVVIATDIGGYVFGKLYGKHKLAPSISPGKTIEGAAGSLSFSLGVAIIFALLLPTHETLTSAIWHALVLSVASQCGDLFESWIKRKAGVKDSGTILPGHGGILDRVDGLVFAAPVYALLVLPGA